MTKLRIIRQTESAECGLACIGMIAGYHGFNTDLNYLRSRFSISQHGVNLKQLLAIANRLNLTGRAVQAGITSLSQLNLPCIIHWNLNHFVVLSKIDKLKAHVLDPAKGDLTFSIDDFGKHFTGIALELIPTSEFKPEKVKQQLKIGQLWSKSSGVGRAIGVVFFLSLILQGFTIISPFYLQTIVDNVFAYNDMDMLYLLAFGFGVVMLANNMTNFLRSMVILNFGSKLSYQIAANLFSHLINLPISYFEKRHTGDIVSRFGSIQQVKELLTTGLVTAIVDGVMALTIFAAMLIYSVKVSFIVLSFVAIYGFFRMFFYKPLLVLSEEGIVSKAAEETNFMESIRAIQTIKIFQKESDRKNIWQNKYIETINAEVKLSRLTILFELANGMLFGLENILVVFFLSVLIMQDAFSIGMLFAFMAYKQQFTQRMDGFITKLIELKMIGLHLGRISDIAFSKTENVSLDCSPSIDNIGIIEVKEVSFQYTKTDPIIISKLSMEFNKGESIALVGPSGCGKTTLIKLLMGLLNPTSGEITANGKSVLNSENYRSRIAGVMQDDQLFSGSLMENIACFSSTIDEEKVISSAKFASIHTDILSLPMGYQTLVGDMGTSLSGGQKQRVMLARALYKEPEILFLDEATSSLDVANESIINENIKRMMITRIIVAHRPETIRSAGRVIDISNTESITIPTRKHDESEKYY
ncbi:peptidase domain-containing ABC transporter [Reinekea sp.]|uniref:peptidase domain-containing ABC transporter n=1 Tax=Reinekea sp. TaxID=1970455 RepID=UPI002370F393|nr:peptidase domain-containing ABC transporter [Reinekea sp.]MDB9894143.1 peptidase domain-containing ABC transporter [Reinekea forsetii]